jgi:GcrA cell cycle regulator
VRQYTVWTREIDARLEALWLGGVSASQISGELWREFRIAVSRSAVIGRLSRKRITRPALTPSARAQSAKAARPQLRRRKIVRLTNHGNRFDRVEVNAPNDWKDDAADLSIPFEQRRGILDLTAGDCRWPVGDPAKPGFFFCGGAALEGSPYCPCHARRAFTTPTKRRTRAEADRVPPPRRWAA